MSRRLLLGLCGVIVVAGLAWVLRPELNVDRVPALTTAVMGCVRVYRDTNGRAPDELELIEPCLENIFGHGAVVVGATDAQDCTVVAVERLKQSVTFRRVFDDSTQEPIYYYVERD